MTRRNDVERLIEAYQITPRPAASERTRRDMLAAHKDARQTQPIWRMIMKNRVTKIGLAAAIILVLALLVQFGSGNSKAGLAFAQVLQQLDEIKTMTATLTYQNLTIDLMSREPGRRRMVFPDGSIRITDLSQKKTLFLNPHEKKASFQELTGSENPGSANILDELKRLRLSAEKDLGQKEIDGRTAKGFQIRKEGTDWIIWVDPDTAYPVRIEFTGTVLMGGTKAVMDHFQFNVDLDASLFALTVPEGYAVESKKAQSPHTPSEKDLVEALRVWSELNGGVFPSDFSGSPETMTNLGLAVRKAKGRVPSDQRKNFAVQSMAKVLAGLGFASRLGPECDWHYVGQNVESGRPGKPVCWWKPAGSSTYRVLYADLTLNDVPPEQLPTRDPSPQSGTQGNR